jgi:lipopolysaccharide export system protein LptA
MRRARRLLLLVILLIVAGVGVTYRVQRGRQERAVPPPPKSLPGHVSAAADHWRWSHTEGNRRLVEVEARNFRQIREPSRFELEEVELRFFQKDGKSFDQVRSGKADFDLEARLLHSPGPVEITLAVPADGSPRGRLLVIRSSGVTFESTTGKARTDRPAAFTFDTAEGQAVGAAYDPATRELELNDQVQLTWRGRGPKPKPMRVEAGHAVYKEREHKVFLLPWSRLTREALTLEAGLAEVTLEEGVIRTVEAREAHGSDLAPQRRLDFQATLLVMRFNDEGQMERLRGEGQARMISTSGTGRTEVSAERVQLEFDSAAGESVLTKVGAMGQTVVESLPAAQPGAPRPASRLLRSETVELLMRPGGREIASIETHAPGQLDFLPARPGERRRHLEAARMWIEYAANNEIRSFRAVETATRTERETGKKTTSTARTWSQGLAAEFDPQTGQLTSMEQWPDFRYEEGDRRARAERAALDAPRDLITLTGRARVWDPSGSADADRIVLDQASGDFTAEGRVTSTRAPDRQGPGSAMLEADAPVQARANRMTASDNRRHVVYEGDAVLWQGASRLQADRIEIDRRRRTLAARGRVVSQFPDRAKEGKGGLVVVRAPEMTYTDEQRLAHYRGGAEMSRPGLTVRGREIRAFLNDSQSDSSLDHALADGQVEIVQTSAGRRLTGSAEHAEYADQEQRIVLLGGEPRLVDSRRGTTRGRRLTYFADRDQLIVEGAEGRPAVSRLKK